MEDITLKIEALETEYNEEIGSLPQGVLTEQEFDSLMEPITDKVPNAVRCYKAEYSKVLTAFKKKRDDVSLRRVKDIEREGRLVVEAMQGKAQFEGLHEKKFEGSTK